MRNEFVWVANDSFPVLSLGFKQALLFQVESSQRREFCYEIVIPVKLAERTIHTRL